MQTTTTPEAKPRIITRREYMQAYSGKTREEQAKEHTAWYAQFHTNGTKSITLSILKRYLPTYKTWQKIPLQVWDSYSETTRRSLDSKLWREGMEWPHDNSIPWSLSDNICILKTYAEILEAAGKLPPNDTKPTEPERASIRHP